MVKSRHLYHIVDRSPWALVSALGALLLTTGLAFYIHRVQNGFFIVILGLIVILCTMLVWWRDVIREATFQGQHTLIVQRGLRIGFMFFIFTEVMIFFSFFWAFFMYSVSPSIVGGIVWPPSNIQALNPLGVPMLNTGVLLLSGLSITWAHYALISGNSMNGIIAFIITILLACFFTILQIGEYFDAPFNISDGIFGTTFYSLTGMHGLHVIIGTIFITVCFLRFLFGHFTVKHHLGFEFATWYWHFVDVVWLFLYVFVYIWGSW